MARAKKAAAENYGTRKQAFLTRGAGDDVMADIAFLAEDIRARTGRACAWDLVDGGTRILWALAIGGAAQIIGMTTDEYIEAARRTFLAKGDASQ